MDYFFFDLGKVCNKFLSCEKDKTNCYELGKSYLKRIGMRVDKEKAAYYIDIGCQKEMKIRVYTENLVMKSI